MANPLFLVMESPCGRTMMLELGDERERRWAAIFIAVALVMGGGSWLWRLWARPPAVEFDNLKYIQLLSTAVSSRDEERVAKVAFAVEERHRQGKLSETELGHFQRIVGLADSGEWETADRECFAFAEAQWHRRRSQPATEGHDHGGAGGHAEHGSHSHMH